MALLVPDEGEVAMLGCMLRDTSPEALVLKLYSNNYDAVEGSTAASFTECSGSGYAAKTLTRAGWSAPSTAAGVSSIAYGTPQAFPFTGNISVVGYYLVGAVSGKVYVAERLYATTGYAFVSGDTLNVTPRLELS